ncbi:aminotransferase class I/II-fold pyridoxal phosphate-dependent enzyme [Calorimonas adulescens]|jgi:Orn/Lys/Arg decarboxylase, C-terminal domain./Orn/Lys/Arg decarboxylase, major domain.|uniref:Aminotransferase class V-fold PLP-dependent enzyme n=1 Tax=Calorimonas adulescens TaxID=2606906 RepID=A0A5D8QF46_9THEO|nr:aminotransferase class V-fold PLP-dependent enzyme [Calorimonas adulescens]TZE82143.1 aminotransferase class V-fold PLP-dependent enzyme [Calorimonas adulescens]
MTAPLFDGLLRHIEKNTIPFHMPGHKQGKGILRADEIRENIFKIDLTELPDTDNLHNANGIILKAEERAARVFGAKKSFFLVNGTTGGIYAMMLATLQPGDKLLIERSCHRSSFGGMILSGVNPAYIEPTVDWEDGISVGVSPESVERALLENRDARAVMVTYPNFYGLCMDIKAIADVVHRYGKILLVDEAHGAHFKFHEDFPITALEAGADMVVQSIHKTLPSFTQSSILHVGSDRIDIDRLIFALRLVQTTSPSYILMSSIDLAIEEVAEHPELMEETVRLSRLARERLADTEGIRVIDEDITGRYGVACIDPTKLVINVKGLYMTGHRAEEILLKDHNIQVELSDMYNILSMITIGDREEDIIKLVNAVKSLRKNGENKIIPTTFDYKVPEIIFNPRDASFMPKRKVALEEAVGRIAGDFLIPYPPGIPYVAPGETITTGIALEIKELVRNGVEVIGYDNGYVTILNI